MRLPHFSLSTLTLLNLNHFPQNESEKVSIALYDRIQISVFVVSLYILESSKKVFVLPLSWSQQFKQSKKLIFVNEGGPVYTSNKYMRLVEAKNNLIKLWIFLLLFANYTGWYFRQESRKPQRISNWAIKKISCKPNVL